MFDIEALRARLQAAGPPPRFDHLHGLDVDALSRLIASDDDDVGEDVKASPRGDSFRRKRRPSLSVIVRQLRKLGVEPTAYQVNPDGSVNVITDGKPMLAAIGDNDDSKPDRSEWH